MDIGSTCDCGIIAGIQSQVITDDLVESLMEISSFFMPQAVIATPADLVNDCCTAAPLQSNVLLAEICSQQILECHDQFSIRLSGRIVEGFATPREFSFFISHSNPHARVFSGRYNLQTFELSEFLRLEYPEISLVLTNSLFSLHFLDFTSGDEPKTLFNGGGCLLFGEDTT